MFNIQSNSDFEKRYSHIHPVDPANPEGFSLLREFVHPKFLQYTKEDILEYYRMNNIVTATMDDYHHAIQYLTEKQEKEYAEKYPPVEYDEFKDDDQHIIDGSLEW